jgi:hypothetical protein
MPPTRVQGSAATSYGRLRKTRVADGFRAGDYRGGYRLPTCNGRLSNAVIAAPQRARPVEEC